MKSTYNKIALYGAGEDILEVLDLIEKNQPDVFSKICGICDTFSSKWGKMVRDFEVTSPDLLKECDAVIITASFVDSIYDNIRKIDADIPVFVAPIPYILGVCDKNAGLQELLLNNQFVLENAERIKSLYQDEHGTRELLDFLLSIRENSPFDLIPYEGYYSKGKFQLSDYYFVDWLMQDIKDLILLDCGGFIGDTVEILESDFRENVQHIFSFEPDKGNYEIMVENVSKYSIADKVDCYQAFLSNFCSNEQEPVRNGSAKNDVEFYTIDSLKCINEYNYDGDWFLKMDVEGAEIAILEGAREFIKTKKPIMAICLYHRYSDILNIPQWIKECTDDGYKFYLGGGIHTFLIAIPNK